MRKGLLLVMKKVQTAQFTIIGIRLFYWKSKPIDI